MAADLGSLSPVSHRNARERRRKPDFWSIVSSVVRLRAPTATAATVPASALWQKGGGPTASSPEHSCGKMELGFEAWPLLLLISLVFPSKFQRSTFEPTRIRGRLDRQASKRPGGGPGKTLIDSLEIIALSDVKPLYNLTEPF